MRVRTSRGQLLRPVQRIFPLEMDGVPSTLEEAIEVGKDSHEDTRLTQNAENGSDFSKSRATESKTTRSGRVVKLPSRFFN